MASIKPYATAKGRAWRVQYYAPDGRKKSKQGFRTKSEAQAWADKNSTTINSGDWIDHNAGKITVEELGTKWLGMQSHVKPSTRELTTQVWSGTVKPHWGARRVDTIRHSDVQAWVSTMGKSGSWTRHAHSVLAQILDVAVRDRQLRENPARGVKLPRRGKAVKVYLTMEQLRLFARECGAREDLILLLGTSGLRWGEAIALRPCDLDPLRNRITVSRNAAKVGNDVALGTPKTHEQRTVAVAAHVMSMLVERSKTLESDELLWTAQRGGWLRAPGHNTWFDGALKRAQAKDGTIPRFTPHGLRHVAAGLLISSGANPKVVQRQLGHSSAAMTLDVYAELFDKDIDTVAQAIDSMYLQSRAE